MIACCEKPPTNAAYKNKKQKQHMPAYVIGGINCCVRSETVAETFKRVCVRFKVVVIFGRCGAAVHEYQSSHYVQSGIAVLHD